MRPSLPGSAVSFVVGFALLSPSAILAQDDHDMPVVFRWSGGTRGRAMANATLTVRDDEAVLYNPAAIGAPLPRVNPRVEPPPSHGASAAWQRIGAATLRSVAAVFETGTLGVGVGVQHLALEASALPLSASEVAREGARPASSLAFVVGAARVVKGMRIGAAVRYGEDRVGDQRVSRTMLDLGIAKAIRGLGWPPGALQLGIAIQYLGGTATIGGTDLRPPTALSLGVNLEGYPRGVLDISGGLAFSVQRDGRFTPRAGWELAWTWIEGYSVQARAGIRRPEFDGQSAVTLGLGLQRDNFFLGYAFEPPRHGPASHRVGIAVR